MKPIITIYRNRSEIQLVVFEEFEKKYSLSKLISVPVQSKNEEKKEEELALSGSGSVNLDGELNFDNNLEVDIEIDDSDEINFDLLSYELSGYDLNKSIIVPIVTQPEAEYYYTQINFNDPKKIEQQIIAEVEDQRTSELIRNRFAYSEADDSNMLSMYVPSSIPSLDMMNKICELKNKRTNKIYSVKGGELALANLLKKNHQFANDEYTLIINSGRTFSNLVFLKKYDVIHTELLLSENTNEDEEGSISFSKILLGMDKASISDINNIFICGDGNFDELFLMLYEVFPNTNIGLFNLDLVDKKGLTDKQIKQIQKYAIPVATGLEIIEELETGDRQIGIVPGGIYTPKRPFQIGWPAFLIIPLLFFSGFHFTEQSLSNNRILERLQTEITQLNAEKETYRESLNQINILSDRVNNFDKTLKTLHSVTNNSTGITGVTDKIVKFISSTRRLWLTQLKVSEAGNISMSGYALDRKQITRFADYLDSTIIENIVFEPLREFKAFGFNLVIEAK